MYNFLWILAFCVSLANVAAEFDNIDELLTKSEVFRQFEKRLTDLEERDLVQQRLILKLTNELAEQKQENFVLQETVAELKSEFDNKNTSQGTYTKAFHGHRNGVDHSKHHKQQHNARPNGRKSRIQRGITTRQVPNQADVAFSAGLTHRFLHAGKDQNIVFDEVTTNIANGYNSHLGAFVAPAAGTYVFHSSILADNDREVWCRFVVNGVHGASLYARGTDGRHDQGANMIIVQLNQGDDVSVQNMAADDSIYGDGIGKRQQPNQTAVAFFAGLSHTIPHAGQGQNVRFDKVTTNIANGYNSHHGVFIAPVAGTYVFHASILAYNGHDIYCQFTVNGVNGPEIYAGGMGRHDQGANMIIVQLNQGDDVSIQNINADASLYGSSSLYTTFSGFLLQAEGEVNVIG